MRPTRQGHDPGLPPPARAAFLARVGEAMRRRGWSQQALAGALDVTQATVSGWFAKGSFPGEVILRMPAALGVDGHWLLTGEGPMEAVDPGDRGYAEGVRRAADAMLAATQWLLEEEQGSSAADLTAEEAEAAAEADQAAEETLTPDQSRSPGRDGPRQRRA